MKKKVVSALIMAMGMGMAAQASAAKISLDHKYEDVSRTHTDEFTLSNHFKFGLKASAELKFQPAEQSNGDSGHAFRDDRWHETKLSFSYPFKLDHQWAIEPGFSWSRKQDEYKYKPSLKIKYALTKQTQFAVRYRDELTDYKTKSTKQVNRYDVSASHSFGALQVGYEYTYYQGNKNLYNHSRHDYQHEVSASYSLTKKWTPFVEVKNESVSSKSSKRQTEYEVGFSYKI
ncbi:MAG: Oligogalacturonate-specific porin KdgM [Candidatus Celerinatantimonas neptuna]|nr:MAG: Oligogalacturonate-specific porin KdgM [Candidatus Celerinatantimonas neptuna]